MNVTENIKDSYIVALNSMNKDREAVVAEFEDKVIDQFRNMVAKWSRENCHLIDPETLVSAGAKAIEDELTKLKGRG